MAPGQEIALARDMTFENIMHRQTATTHEGFSAMLNKDKEAQRAAVAEYFQHWDNKEAKNETEADREVSQPCILTQPLLDHSPPPPTSTNTIRNRHFTNPTVLPRHAPGTTPP